MEQQLNATYLRPGLIQRAAAVGIAAAGIGTGVLLAAWGISFLWRYTPPEIAVRVANPEIRVTQDKPLTVASPPPIKIDPDVPTLKIERSSPLPGNGLGTDRKTSEDDVIRRDVTVFSTVKHATGQVTTGWNYRDGTGGIPVRQYCYYSAPKLDYSSTRVDIAFNGDPLPNISASLVPELQGALAKCQWWQG
jgi:hypothetical protein